MHREIIHTAHRITGIKKGSTPPASRHVVLVLKRGCRKLGAADKPPPAVFGRDALIVKAADTFVAARKKAQIRRHRINIIGKNGAERNPADHTWRTLNVLSHVLSSRRITKSTSEAQAPDETSMLYFWESPHEGLVSPL